MKSLRSQTDPKTIGKIDKLPLNTNYDKWLTSIKEHKKQFSETLKFLQERLIV